MKTQIQISVNISINLISQLIPIWLLIIIFLIYHSKLFTFYKF